MEAINLLIFSWMKRHAVETESMFGFDTLDCIM